jgi:hypothetical protein
MHPGRIGVLACAVAAKNAANNCSGLKCTGEDAYTPRRECTGEDAYTPRRKCTGGDAYTPRRECTGEDAYTPRRCNESQMRPRARTVGKTTITLRSGAEG